ncbi:minor tail protein [Gordonia phage Mcklovin]|uniref:Minor tail protein n=1 Tax=Gordonia phage Mcklovin TaxID=2652881 RepID=A0A5P8DCU2_9CAUD|nr:minor tail protein [Gordonia phage Mcklovin]QFP96814.1 minor tail protein [Gordonia phage Mcklovin]
MARFPTLGNGDKIRDKHLPTRLDTSALNTAYAAPVGVGLKTGAFTVAAGGGQTPSGSLGVSPNHANIVNTVRLPVTTTRWRLHVRNYNIRDSTAYPGQVAFTGVWLSQFTDVDTGWDGKAKAAPVQAMSAWTATDLSTEYVGPWVTATNLQFQKNANHQLSVGYQAAAGVSVGRGYAGMFYTGNQADASSQGVTRNPSESSVFDIWIEYEAYTDAPLGLVIGDSLTVGRRAANDAGLGMLSSWPVAHSLRTRSLNNNVSLSGGTLDIWASAASFKMSRWSSIPWDYVVIALGTNNIDNGDDLATIKTKYAATVAAARTAYPTAKIYVATIPPRTYSGDNAAKHVIRNAFNEWIQSLPFGVHGCFRLDQGLASPTDANALAAAVDCGDGTHMKTIGSQIMDKAIPGRI